MGTIIKNGILYSSGFEFQPVTREVYEALPEEEKTLGAYVITDEDDRDMNADQIKYESTTVEDALKNMWNYIYPVGAIYISTVDTNPQTLFGGTWEQIKDTFLLSAGTSYSAGSTGGSANSVVPYHTHTFTGSAVTSAGVSANHYHATTVTFTNNGSHAHGFGYGSPLGMNSGSGDLYGAGFAQAGQGSWWWDWGKRPAGISSNYHSHSATFNSGYVSAGHTHSVTASGSNSYAGTNGNTTGANMPPYLAVYVWKRTA